MRIAISAETTIDLPKSLLQEFDIHTLPFALIMGEDQYMDGEVGKDDLYAFVKKTGQLPRTAAVNEFQFEEFFAELLKTHDEVVHFALSSKISAAYKNAASVAQKEEFKGKVHVIDTLSLSTGIALLAIYGSKLVKAGKTSEEIVSAVKERIPHDQTSFVLETLDYLYKGGRCTALQRFGANLLAIKPQIIMTNGSMATGKKYRGNIERAIQAYVEDTLKEFPNFDPSLIFITTTMDADKQGIIETVRKRLEKEGFERIEVTTAGGTIACHCGPNTLGILYLNDGPHPIAE